MSAPSNPFSPPPAGSRLGRYRLLGPACGLRVSPLQLGAMSIGDAQASTFGSIDQTQAFELLDTYYDLGGNYIDCANSYQLQQSERWVGEWMKKRDNRDNIVLATKYTSNYVRTLNDKHPIQVNFAGNSYKSMVTSLEASLKKLHTTYIDILYIHWWDWTTPVSEVMQGLNNLVKAGKVLYLGVSDTPAWIVSKANEYARSHGLAPFVLYQGRWSPASRDMERDLLPMARSEGMGIAPWGAIGQGKFQRKKDQGQSKDGRSAQPLTDDEVKVSAALEKVADELGVESVTSVALAWVIAKYPYTFPIVGGRRVEHLKANIGALDIHLTLEQIRFIDKALPFDYGQPMSEFGLDPHTTGYQQHPAIKSAGLVDFVPHPLGIDYSSVRQSDDEANAAWRA